jgi:hypothetical protein
LCGANVEWCWRGRSSHAASFRTQYAVKSNIIVLVTLIDFAINSFGDHNDVPSLPRWSSSVLLG